MRKGKEIDLLVLMRAKLGGSAKVAQILEEDIKDGAAYLVTSASGSPASFPDGADDIPVVDLKVSIDPVQPGSGDPSPENVRPISGWTGANVFVTGKNLFDGSKVSSTRPDLWPITFANDVLSVTRTTSSSAGPNLILQLSRGTYVISASAITAGTIYVNVNNERKVTLNSTYRSATFEVEIGDSVVVQFYVPSNDTTATFAKVQVEAGTTATEYEQYRGNTYSISWQTEAGTVYGGTLDVITGVLTVTHGYIASYAGETLPGAWISDRDVYAEGTSPSTGAQVVYELAEPEIYQLTPTEVKTLLGGNNIWADCGAVDVEYRADLDKYIEKRKNPAEAAVGTLGLGLAPSVIRPGVGLEMQDYPMDAPGSDWSGRLYPEDAPWDEKPEGFPEEDEYDEPEEEDTEEEEPEEELTEEPEEPEEGSEDDAAE